MSGTAGWEPATDAEVALYDALAAGDQEAYFQALGRANLLLPVSAEAAAGRSPVGWGTWTANNHTHLLAFTSDQSMRTCLAQHVGGARRMSLRELAAVWPNNDWWLAVNPGLPIEGYLPAWFVAQLARGDARLPGQRSSMPRDRLERVQALERAKAAKAAALPREPIRTIATAGGPLALPPAAASPRWARGPSSIVDAEEVGAALPRRTPAKPSTIEPEAWPPGSAGPVRGGPSTGRPSTADEAQTRGDNRAAGVADDRWAGLAESRWAALAPERTEEARQPRQPTQPLGQTQPLAEMRPERGTEAAEQRPAERRSLLGDEQPTQRIERRSLFDDGQQTQRVDRGSLFGDEQQTQRVDRRSLFGEEQLTEQIERRSLFEAAPAEQSAEQPAAKPAQGPQAGDEQPTTMIRRPVVAEEKQAGARAEGPRHAEPEPEFIPANAVEEQLYEAAEAGNTDAFLSTLLLATVLIPKASGTTNGKWRPQPIDGEPHIVSYTSAQHLSEPLETIPIKFVKLISEWPDPNWSFAVNPGTPVGATLPGGQLLALANWAAEVGLGGDDDEDYDEPSVKLNGTPVAGRVSPEVPVLQKAIAPSQVSYYLERGYDRVTGFVHRAHEVGHLKSASQMRAALGLDFEGSPFSVEADEIYLLRWSAHRPSLYRIPYGGQSESAMRAMQGWVIERAPFRGNGFAPGETGEVIAEFKVDSARLPHGARLLRLKDGTEDMVAIFDADTQKWLRTDGGS